MEDERRPSRGGAEIDGERSLGTRGRGRESAGSWAGVGPSGEEGQQRSMSMGRGSARRCSGSVSVRASGEERERIRAPMEPPSWGDERERIPRAWCCIRSGVAVWTSVRAWCVWRGRATGRVGARGCGTKFDPVTWLNVRPAK
jgi:hypothetical protein